VQSEEKRPYVVATNQHKHRSYAYGVECPTVEGVLESLSLSLVIPQYAYFSNAEDLYKHYGVNHRRVSKSSLYLQYLCRQAEKLNPVFYVASLRNTERLPHDFRIDRRVFKRTFNAAIEIRPRSYVRMIMYRLGTLRGTAIVC
jgi:hypothetical protein